MAEVKDLLVQALQTVCENLDKPELAQIASTSNVFDAIDSFTVVDLMLESEMLIEASLGRYVTLADETMFDAEKSPLLSWSDWVAYVEKCCAEH
jgi:hypothetical protein